MKQNILRQLKRLLLLLSAMKSSTRKAVFVGLSRLLDLATIVRFETILGWPRNLIARKFDGSKAPRKPGRRLTDDGISELMLTIVDDNPTWGYRHVWILYWQPKYAGIVHIVFASNALSHIISPNPPIT